MPHVTIEYVIMLPILIMQILLFPLAAGWLMNVWVDSRRTLALQDVAGHLGSTIQQLYFSLNHETITAGTATYLPGLPPFIEDFPYTANATLHSVVDPEMNSSKILELTVRLMSTKISITTSVVLGPNVLWQESNFLSNSTVACVTGLKAFNGTMPVITLKFGE